MEQLELVVRQRRQIAESVVELTLGAADGGALPSWSPGAHVDLVLAEAEDGRPPLVRQYSLCGPEASDRWRIAVLLEPGGRGGSRFVHERLEPGTRLRARGPRNLFPLTESRRAILLAGGIGITPLLPMARRLARTGADWRLVYGGRSRAAMAYLDELAVYGERVRIVAQDEQGLPDLGSLLGRPLPDTAVYCCGPAGLIAEAERLCRSWPAGALRCERFQPEIGSGVPAGPDSGFEVELARSGRRLTVPAGRSVLEVLQAAGVAVLSSCAEGTCGTCETRVLDGEPEHRDEVLGEAERADGKTMMVCVSRSRGPRLVLDL